MKQLFRDHLRQHCESVGWDMPVSLESYLVDLLAARLDRVDLIPDPSFAERYLILHRDHRIAELVDYADSCLFFTSLMPEYGSRRGLSLDYYATLGVSSYYTVGDHFHDDRYIQLGNWFYHLQKFLNSAIRPDVRLRLWHF